MKVLAIILAGGKGTRLEPLVTERCKPAVPFGGKYRIIDFVLSNCLNSGIRCINVMVQYKSDSLQKHIRDGWSILSPSLGEYIDVYPPQQRRGEKWYAGTADAIFQNFFSIESEKPDIVLVLSGDHIYRMDYREMIEYHIEKQADLSIACLPVPKEDGSRFGVMETEEDDRIVGFEEKPANPKTIPGRDSHCMASMGIYVFSLEVLKKELNLNAREDDSHDFAKDIIPNMIPEYKVFAFPFTDANNNTKYWKDVGTIGSYFQANLDLLNVDSGIDLYDKNWKFRTFQAQASPSRIIAQGSTFGMVINSILGGSNTILGTVKNSIIGPNVFVDEEVEIKDSILFGDSRILNGAKIKRAIVDKHVTVPPNFQIGYNEAEDRKRFFITEDKIVVIPRSMKIEV